MDPAIQLQRLYIAGFDIEGVEMFGNTVGVMRDGCIALLRTSPAGLQMIGTPDWRMGRTMGVLVEKEGKPVFQAKSEFVEATPERLELLRKFKADLERLLTASA